MFDAHGRFRVTVHGDVLVVDGWGPWDKQTAAAYSRAVDAATLEMRAPWAALIRFRSEPLMWTDTRDHIRDAVRMRVARGMRSMAVVMPDMPEANLVRAQYAQLYGECGAEFAFFLDDEPALAWLETRGHAAAAAAIRATAGDGARTGG